MDNVAVEDAAQKVEKDENFKNKTYDKEILDIYNYGNATDLSIPDV